MSENPTNDLSRFVSFLKVTRVQLAAILALIPLANLVVDFIPRNFLVLSPNLAPSVTTAVCSILILFIFSGRHQIEHRGEGRDRQVAFVALIAGVISILGYLVVSSMYWASPSYYWYYYYGYYSSIQVVYELTLVGLYISMFALLVSSFVILGLLEFLNEEESAESEDQSGFLEAQEGHPF